MIWRVGRRAAAVTAVYARGVLLGLGLSLAALLPSTDALAQTGQNVLVVVNARSSVSIEIGEYYIAARGIPDDQLVRVDVDVVDEISRAAFTERIERPIRRWLSEHAAQDRILYIVLTKDVPLRVTGTLGRTGTVASVDSELTVLYRKMVGMTVPPTGRIANPFFEADVTTIIGESGRFSHDGYDIYLVTRLDGFTLEDVRALIDHGLNPSSAGRVLLDQRADLQSPAEQWLADAAEALVALSPDRVLLETTTRAAVTDGLLLGYYSWGSNDPSLLRRNLGVTFAPGAIVSSYVGTSARTFTEPPEDWQIGRWQDRRTYYASSPEWLAGDLIRQGATGVVGHVADPYLDGAVRPAPLFASYLTGFNLAESAYRALPDLSWRAVVIGDPLVAPFDRPALADEVAAPIADPQTRLPRFFSARRVAQLVEAGTAPIVVPLLIRADAELTAENPDGARPLLEEAMEVGEIPIATELTLAGLYERSGDAGRAVELYRSVLERSPNDVTALNNLAYLLMDGPDTLGEAFQLAQRAYVLSQGNPLVADTLGWIYHLRGNNREALRYLSVATTGAPTSAEIRLHTARVHLAAGQLEAASETLSQALELDPTLSRSPDVESLREELEAPNRPEEP